jgi:cytoplasmic iron level regulating protein YaaA (DUF328/UPF0246 family)
MRIVLPPSETKQAGGTHPPLDLGSLACEPCLGLREELVAELQVLSSDTDAAMKALKLGVTGVSLLAGNLSLTTQPTLPAISRYTGVVYDAVNYDTLDVSAQTRADQVVWIFSALFGPLRATDLIPTYRLSANSALPGGKLASRWGGLAPAIWSQDFTVDLRSEAYRQLAPLTPGAGVFVRIVTDQASGRVAVGHANKATKGTLVRDLVTSGVEVAHVNELVDWGTGAGYRFELVPDNSDEVWLVLR